MTLEEEIKFQSVLPKQGIAPKPLTESEIRALFAPVRKRMEAKGCYTKQQIRVRLDEFRNGKKEQKPKFPLVQFKCYVV